MRRPIALIVVGAVLVLAVVGSGLATGRGLPTAITLSLHSKLEHATYVDNHPTGRSAGDDLVFTEKLLSPHGRVVGSDAASCVYLFGQRSLCTGAYALSDGQIMVQLIQPGPTGRYTQAITAGTGRYARATGTVTVDQHAGADHFTFHIRLATG